MPRFRRNRVRRSTVDVLPRTALDTTPLSSIKESVTGDVREPEGSVKEVEKGIDGETPTLTWADSRSVDTFLVE